MTADWRTPGPDRPTDPRDELVQALLGLRWALPRTDADARVALDQLAAVATRVEQLAGEYPDEETPWDGQVQALLAQAGFALDWWRPVLDDVDLDWTLNHQAHLSADLARIASAGARILDQYAPAMPNPVSTPPSAITEGPPHPAPRVATAFGSVPATAILDPLANSGRHRRPAYEFDSLDPQEPAEAAPEHSAPQVPVQFDPWPHQPHAPAPAPSYGQPVQLPPLPQELEPELEQLFRPQQPHPQEIPHAGSSATSVPIFGPPSIYAPSGPPDAPQQTGPISEPGFAAPPRNAPYSGPQPPPAFSRPVVWAGPGGNGSDGDDEYDPIVRPDRRGPHGAMVVQAVGILGAVAALCWWAVSSLHIGASPAGHPAAQAGSTHTAHPAVSTPAKAHPATSPTPQSTHSAVTPVTTPPTSPPPPNAAGVKSIQVSLLGGSPAVHQVAMILAVNTNGTGQVTVTVDYWGEKNGAKADERTASWTLSGKTAYSIGASIPADAYCGEQFTLKAVSGDTTATQQTTPGC
ncbi:MAG TPA: hypothetical protein VFU65_09450 [Actinocrinis sp.]|nr:hypothetical protein [Actinocrinis sp.]